MKRKQKDFLRNLFFILVLIGVFISTADEIRAQSISGYQSGFLQGVFKPESGETFSFFGGDIVSGVFQSENFSLTVGTSATAAYILYTNAEQRDPLQTFSHQLHPNFPNPFNPVTNIRFELAEAAMVQIRIFDLLGRQIAVPVDGRKSPGVHTASFDARSLASGIYVYALFVDGIRLKSRQMTLLK